MYHALTKLPHRRTPGAAVAEIALSLAGQPKAAVILAASASGAPLVVDHPVAVKTRQRKIASATLAAVETMLDLHTDAAILCVGPVEEKNLDDLREACEFSSKYKLPFLYLVANRITPGTPQAIDLRSFYPEFGLPVFSVDARDAIAAYRVATEALYNARYNRGPAVIEALSVQGEDTDPLALLGSYMERHGVPLQV